MRLSKVLAAEVHIKKMAHEAITHYYALIGRGQVRAEKTTGFGSLPWTGFRRAFTPRDESVFPQPAESLRPQVNLAVELGSLTQHLKAHFDVELQRCFGNREAMADLIIDEKRYPVPATYLLFLDKKLSDIRKLVEALPVLPLDQEWTWDESSLLFRSSPTRTQRTVKKKVPIVLYPATPEHAAQTQLIDEDVIEGVWERVDMSTAIPVASQQRMLAAIDDFLLRVRTARAEANQLEVIDVEKIGEPIFKAIFGEWAK